MTRSSDLRKTMLAVAVGGAALATLAACQAFSAYDPVLDEAWTPEPVLRAAQGEPGTDSQFIDPLLEPRLLPVADPLGKPRESVTGQSQRAASPGAVEFVMAPGQLPGGLSAAPEQVTEVLTPTYSWVTAFSLNSTLDGKPVPAGAVVTAYDPQGVLLGRVVVQRPGQYGVMPLYMDDPGTSVDEGARPGDVLQFRINGVIAAVTGTSAPVWTYNGAILAIDLAATNSAVN
jgi:hypothetical protein